MRIVMYIDYNESQPATSYELENWVTKTFGNMEDKDEFREIRDSSGHLKQLRVVIDTSSARA